MSIVFLDCEERSGPREGGEAIYTVQGNRMYILYY
jgi:hypothetical protein